MATVLLLTVDCSTMLSETFIRWSVPLKRPTCMFNNPVTAISKIHCSQLCLYDIDQCVGFDFYSPDKLCTLITKADIEVIVDDKKYSELYLISSLMSTPTTTAAPTTTPTTTIATTTTPTPAPTLRILSEGKCYNYKSSTTKRFDCPTNITMNQVW